MNNKKKINKLVVNCKENNFGEWYREIITKGEMINYSDIGGCYILLSSSCSIWDNIKNYLNKEFKLRDVENCYFPLFVTRDNLNKEQVHLEGFKAEVAWIKNEDKEGIVKESIMAIRPTSECIICPNISKQIRSYKDLPKKINQYCNVVRWEFKETIPFIRSREFLWQEGHTYYANKDEAKAEVYDIINLYKTIYEKQLAVPVIMGLKTKGETFAGAEYTYTIEGYIPEANKGIQCATSHHLGQTFTKMFDIKYDNESMQTEYCYYNSWGFTTRSIGVMVQTHGDDKGLIFPPNIAPIHIIIIPIYNKNNKDKILQFCINLKNELNKTYSVKLDLTENSPGYKHNYWELKGVPLRMEIGEKEIDNKIFTVARRDSGDKIKIINLNEIELLLNQIQDNLYNRALKKLLDSINYIENEENIICNKLILVNLCDNEECEKIMKDKYDIKALCIPEDEKINEIIKLQKSNNSNNSCILCGKVSKNICLFGKSY